MDATLAAAPVDRRAVQVSRLPHAPGLDMIVVQVPVDQTARYTLRRLVPAATPVALAP
jgi:hypothetical protein